MTITAAPNRMLRAGTARALLLASVTVLAATGSARAQFAQLPPGFEGLIQFPAGAAPGGLRGLDCASLAEMSRQGQRGPGGMDPRQLMETMRCPSAETGAREKAPAVEAQPGGPHCGMLRQSLEDPSSGGAWLGPMPVHAAIWMLESCRAQATPAELQAWGGLARFGEGRYAESAEALFKAATQANDPAMRIRFTLEMAKSLVAAGRNAEAREAVERTLAYLDRVLPEAKRDSQGGWALTQQQALSRATRENEDEDRNRARRGLRGELFVLRGLTYLNDNDPARAADSLREASALLSPDRVPGMPEFPMRDPGAALADVYLAMALARTGRGDEAVALLQKLIGGRDQFVGMAGQVQGSIELAQDAIGQLGLQGINVPKIEMPKSTTAGMESGMLMSGELFHLGSACALLQEIHLQAKAPELALEAAEQCRARVLARSLADRAFQRQGRVTLPTQQEARAYARKNRVDEGAAYQALIKDRMSNPAADAASRAATVADIRRAAAERNATIIVYSIHTEANRLPDRMPDREVSVTIWVVAPDGRVTARRSGFDGILGEGTLPLTAAVYRAREALDVPGRGAAPAAAIAKGRPVTPRAAAALRRFHRLLIEPVEDLLPAQDGARLLFVPQGALFVVPFPALENRDGTPLVARYAISVVPSVQTLALTSLRKRAAREPVTAVIVGNPVMPVYSPAPGRPPLDLGPLPGAEAEATAIAVLLKTTALTGAAATKSAVMGQARTARYVHLATHGILDDVTGEGQRGVNPHVRDMTLSSMEQREDGGHKTPGMLALAPGGGDSGMLLADEISQATIAADLVVMSACDSGRGAINDDGVIGLSRAWMAAGAPSVVVSLWSIADEPTRDLMVEFYRRLAAGGGKAEALRGAMLATRAQYPSPVNWAAFVLLGEPD